ncbi:hypothetical protein D3C87_1902430 [compost metagenome]
MCAGSKMSIGAFLSRIPKAIRISIRLNTLFLITDGGIPFARPPVTLNASEVPARKRNSGNIKS